MAESEFNLGPNYPPGGAPENPRVNNSAYDSEMKKTQQLQAETLKSLNETIKGLSEQYAELNANDRKLTDEELAASKMLREKIDVLSQILESVKSDASKGGPQVPLSAIGIKERTETFTKLSKVITDFQRSSADLKAAGGGEMEFDQWFSTYLEQQKLDNLSLSQQEHNNLLLQDVKKILKDSNTSLSSLSEDELEELARRSIKLSIDQKQIETDLLAQNRDVIKLNKDANAQDIKNTKAIVESSKFDPSKPIIEYGFKTVNKQMKEIVENTKPRSLFKIVTDLMGPLGKIIYFFTKVVVGPLLFTFGIITGFLLVQYGKLKGLGSLLSGEIFLLFLEGLKRFKNIIVFLYKDVPLIVSSFINQVSTNAAKAVQPIRTISKIFSSIASGSETFFFAWTRILNYIQLIPYRLAALFEIFKNFESNIGKLSKFEKIYVVVGDALIGIGKIIDKLKPTFEIIGKFGTAITNLASYIGSIVGKIFSPVTQLFSSKLGKALIGFDKLGVGLSSMFKFGVSMGKWLGGVTPWFVTLITLFADIPKFFKALFYTDAYTAIKSVMGLIVEVAGLVLSTLFGGPLGAIAASYVLKFDNIMKWLDPIFDFIIYTGGIVLGLLYSIYKDFVQPAFEAIGQVALTVLNLGFALLKPIFKFAQFVLLLLTPLFAIVALAFKGVGYIFKGISILFKAINDNIVEPFIKFSEWFMFKFIQPVYDWLANTWFGKLAGMETKEQRLKRETREKIKKIKSEGNTEESSTNTGFSIPEFNIGIDKSSIDAGIGKSKEFVTHAVDKGVGVVENTVDSLKFISKDFSGSIQQLTDSLKTQLTPIANTMVYFGKIFGMRATEFGIKALPIAENVLINATTPISGYSTSATITPSNAPANNRMAEEYQWMASLLEKASGDEKNRAANNTVNNQQTTVVNNTSGGSSMTMPSNSERTVNQINNSVRPAG